MKTCHIFRCLFWAVLYCSLNLVVASEEDLADFDFSDRKEIEWNYDTERIRSQPHNKAAQNFIEPLAPLDYSEEENKIRPFDWRENVLKGALSKALTNTSLRQKFVEVMPILRVLSSQQRLALSALISAQINAKGDQKLKLEQVRMMFGDDKKLLLPIVYDIANLVRTSARKYLDFNFDDPPSTPKQQHKGQIAIDRRIGDLFSGELAEDDNDKGIGRLSMPDIHDTNELSLEDFFSETGEEMLDPQSINEELQDVTSQSPTPIINATSTITSAKRAKRAVGASEFVHKLIRSVPLSINKDDNSRGVAENMVKLNTSGFLSSKDLQTSESVTSNTSTIVTSLPGNENTPITANQFQSTQSYQEVEDIAFASLNGTLVDLQVATETSVNTLDEPLPSPEELIAGPRYRISSNKMHFLRPNQPTTKRKRVQVSRMRSKAAANNNIGGGGKGIALQKNCERFTSSMCIRTEDYPLDQIMGSIRRHKNAMTALWADYHDKYAQLDISDDFDDFSIRRREDDATGGGMCQSIIRYARPQKARSASGDWKYIVNTGQHTQTLRLEKCTTPHESCSYLAHSYRSHCAQVYNYHRLLSWDKVRGLHVDIFKVPTCCSCQVDGFRQQFPPLAGSKTKEFNPAKGVDVYSTINEYIDYNDEQEQDDRSNQLNHGFKVKHKKHDSGYDSNELSSVRAKLHTPNPTLGSYLSPPGGEEEYEIFDSKNQKHHHQNFGSSYSTHSVSAGKNIIRDPTRRRPYKSLGSANLYNEARVDLDLSPSELHPEKEVKLSGGSLANPNKRVPQKRQRIHSVPHIATVSNIFTSAAETDATISTISNNIRMAAGFTTPSTTAGQHGVVGNRTGIATNAYQTSAPGSIYNGTSQKQTNFSNNLSSIYRNKQFINNSGKKQKPRFHSAAAAPIPSRATLLPTEHSNQWNVFQHQQSTPAVSPRIPPYNINSINHPDNDIKEVGNDIGTDITKLGETVRTSSGPGPKRINYSYHPIIDFFENHKYSTTETKVGTIDEPKKEFDDKNRQIFPHKIIKSQTSDRSKDLDMYQPRERRIGFGMTTSTERSGIVLRDRTGSSVRRTNNFNPDDNGWQPIVVRTVDLS